MCRRRLMVLATWMPLALICSLPSGLTAQERAEIALWPQGLPSDAKPIDAEEIASLQQNQTEERISYVEHPSLTLYRPAAERANGCSVVICPGGGYNILAWPKEGLEVAEWFNTIGVTAAVLQYRVPRRDPERPHWEPLQDVQRAIRLVRSHADEWGLDTDRVGVLGFSAGGHLAIMAATQYEANTYDHVDDADKLSARPDFLCGIYAAYLGTDYQDGYQDDERAEIGSLVKITKQTPPAFLAVTLDDRHRGVQAGLLLEEFKRAGVPAEAHIYASGGHGYGIRPSANPVSTWHLRLAEWMQANDLLADD